MIDLISLASTGLAFFVVAVSPGPANISNATIAMNHGRKASLIYGLGLSCGLVFRGLIAASGMGAVLRSSLLFSIGGMMRSYRRFRHRINGVVAILFTAGGFGLIRSAFTR